MAKTFSLDLKSQFSEIERIPGLIEKIDQETRLGEDLKQRIALTLSEAATNAVLHGNRENKDKRVAIVIQVMDDNVTVTVTDEGKGFDPDTIPDPVEEENLLKTGGRGLFLMQEFCDEISYSDGGRTVTLTFHR